MVAARQCQLESFNHQYQPGSGPVGSMERALLKSSADRPEDVRAAAVNDSN
jgi:hypothetical protein